VGGPLTGRPLDLGIIDDPIKNAQEANSETVKNGVWDWYVSTFLTRLSKNSGQIIMATRWATDDLTGRVLAKYDRAKLLKFQAIDDEGRALIPELHPIEKLNETRAAIGEYYWAALYQQSPVPAGGGMFKPHQIEVVDALPAGLRFVRGWDLAASKDAGDWTVGAKLAERDGVIYVADIARLRGGPDEIERLIVNTAAADGATPQSLPQDPGQAGKAQAAYLSKKLAGRIFEFTPETGDKATRASPFAAQVNAGNVKMIKAEWNDALTHEMRSFPMGAHDDQIDACSRAYNKVSSKAAMRINAQVLRRFA
jgi:predicted phage terminase large subunit-like protein